MSKDYLYLPVLQHNYRKNRVKRIFPFAFLNIKDCQEYFNETHSCSEVYCGYCNNKWKGSIKEFSEDDVDYSYFCMKIKKPPSD